MVAKAISDYLSWMISKGYAETTYAGYERVLKQFLLFVSKKKIPWDEVFTFDTLKAFKEESGLSYACTSPSTLARYLFNQKRIPRPIEKPFQKLPDIYEEHIRHYTKSRQVHYCQILRTRRTLEAFNDYLNKENVRLPRLRIEHVDIFLAKRNSKYAPCTRGNQRSNMRGFLRFLYAQDIISRDLARLVVGAPVFGQSKPPKFLRPDEVKKIFESMSTSSPKDLRTSAMVHIGYTLGMRPREISLINLDDISFKKGEIKIPDRKSNNPIILPLPEVTIKAIASYIVGARPKSDERMLFLSFRAPYKPLSAGLVSFDIKAAMLKAGLSSTAYWLRHTYAQNLLEANASIFEVKEMMGHGRIQTTGHYLHIHTNLMRRELFE